MATHPYRQRVAVNTLPELNSSADTDYIVPIRGEALNGNDFTQHFHRDTGVSSPRFTGERPLNLGSFNNANGRNNVASPDILYSSDGSYVPGLNLDTPHATIPAESVMSGSEPDLTAVTQRLNGLGHNRSVSSCLSFFKSDSSPYHYMDQSLVKQHLGTNSSSLKSRLEVSEQYRKNAKRSNDPKVLFQYAQFMLQMALELKDLEKKPVAVESPSGTDLSMSLSEVSSTSRKQSSVNLSSTPELQQQMSFFLKEAQHYLRRLSDKGYVEAQYLFGDAWSSGAFGKVDNEKAFSLFLVSAKHGHTESAFRVAHCYEEGLGTGRDARKGIEFLKKAASDKHPAAMYKLGVYHFYARMGIADTMTNKKMGMNWLERAASVATELTAAAPYELGKIYYVGYKDIVIRDLDYAVKLFTKAAALGHVEAAARLGEHYEDGEDTIDYDHLSIHYYTEAAKMGHPGAMLALGAWYLCGSEGLPADESEAALWIKKSAECGFPKGQYTYAYFLQKGRGVQANPELAQQMFIKAAEGGYQKALDRIEDKDVAAKIAKRMKKVAKSSTDKDDPDAKCAFM